MVRATAAKIMNQILSLPFTATPPFPTFPAKGRTGGGGGRRGPPPEVPRRDCRKVHESDSITPFHSHSPFPHLPRKTKDGPSSSLPRRRTALPPFFPRFLLCLFRKPP